jgi:hypothetical protein
MSLAERRSGRQPRGKEATVKLIRWIYVVLGVIGWITVASVSKPAE